MKIKHVLKAVEFAEILSRGRKYRGKAITIYTIETSDPKNLAIGLIVPKKQAPKAVTRNYIRRVIYTFFQDNLGKNIKGGKIAVRVTESLAGLNKKPLSGYIREELKTLAKKAGFQK